MECYTKSCGGKHRQIVSSIADRNSLRNVHILHLSYQFQQFGFPAAVDNLTEIAPGQFSVNDFKFIGIDIVKTIFLLEIISEIGETA